MKSSVVKVGGLLSFLSERGVEKRLGRVHGVKEVSVNALTGSALIAYDDELTTPDLLKHAVKAAIETTRHPRSHGPRRPANLTAKGKTTATPPTAAAPPSDAQPNEPVPATLADPTAKPDKAAADATSLPTASRPEPGVATGAQPSPPATSPMIAAKMPAPAGVAPPTASPPSADARSDVAAASPPDHAAHGAKTDSQPLKTGDNPPSDASAPKAAASPPKKAIAASAPAAQLNGAAQEKAPEPTNPAEAIVPASQAEAAVPARAVASPAPPAAADGVAAKDPHASHGGQVDATAQEMGHGGGKDMASMARDMRNRFWIALAFSLPIFVF